MELVDQLHKKGLYPKYLMVEYFSYMNNTKSPKIKIDNIELNKV